MTRKTQKKLRKLLTLVSCAVLLVCVTIAGTVAYLTSTTGVVENTFVASSNVKITLDEADVDELGVKEQETVVTPGEDGEEGTDDDVTETKDKTRVTENEYKLVPGHNYVKDPTIHVDANSDNCWLFVKVDNGISAIEADTTIAAQMTAKGWSLVSGQNNVYAYKDIVTAGADVVVFDNFTIKNEVNSFTGYENASITVQAYAVQADGFDTSAAAWTAAPCTWGE